MLAIWNARATPRRTICGGDRPPISSPASFTVPRSGRIAPEIKLKNVVLPAPLGPMIAVSEPAAKSSVTFAIAATPPKDFESPSTANISGRLLSQRCLRRVAGFHAGPRERGVPVPEIDQHIEQPAPQPERKDKNDDAEREAVIFGVAGHKIVENQQDHRADRRTEKRVQSAQHDDEDAFAGNGPIGEF